MGRMASHLGQSAASTCRQHSWPPSSGFVQCSYFAQRQQHFSRRPPREHALRCQGKTLSGTTLFRSTPWHAATCHSSNSSPARQRRPLQCHCILSSSDQLLLGSHDSLSSLSVEPADDGIAAISAPVPDEPELQNVPLLEGNDLWDWRKQLLEKVLRFAGPAIVIPLADPLMSLVDTVTVGRYAGTVELASLGPNCLIFNFTTYIFNSLTVATVSVIAERLAIGQRDEAANALTSSLLLALLCGVLVMVCLLVFAEPLMRTSQCAPELMRPALSYLRVRALAAPAVLLVMISQAGLLAQRDSVTPLIAVALQAAVNLTGDIYLITKLGMGVAGAAWATVGAQYVGTLALLWAMFFRAKLKPGRKPSFQDLAALSTTFGPMSFINLCKNLCYAMLQRTATALLPVAVAAHQLMYSMWSLCSFATMPLEQSSLAFMPSAYGQQQKRETATLVMWLGVGIGVTAGVIATAWPVIAPQHFTKDVVLWPLMRSVAPQTVLSMVLCGIDVAAGSVLVVSRDLKYVARSITVTLAVTAGFFAVSWRLQWGLAGVWWGLVLFFAMRSFQNVPRVLKLYATPSSKLQAAS